MKKLYGKSILFLFLMCCMIFVFQNNVYSASLFTEGEWCPDFSQGAVAVGDVLKWSREIEQGEQTLDSYDQFFSECAVPLLTTIELNNSPELEEWNMYEGGEEKFYAVFNEQGEYAYKMSMYISEAEAKGPYLKSCSSGKDISLQSGEKEILEFLQEDYAYRNEIRKKFAYVVSVLNEDEYVDCQYRNQRVQVLLINMEKKNMLLEFGISVEEAGEDIQQVYREMEKMWQERELLGVQDICIDNNNIEVIGRDSEEEFAEKIKNIGCNVKIIYKRGIWGTAYNYMIDDIPLKDNAQELSEYIKNNFGNLESPDIFVDYLYQAYRLGRAEPHLPITEGQWEKLSQALRSMKQRYSEYSCKNLYYHIAGNGKAEEYLDFDRELLEYVDGLPEYKEDGNGVIEQQFGDPEILELKRMLRQYKNKYPDMEYQDIYDTYLKEVEENDLLSKEEKLYWYLWKKYSFDRNIMNQEKGKASAFESGEEKGDENSLFLIAGIAMIIVASSLVVIMKKGRKN